MGASIPWLTDTRIEVYEIVIHILVRACGVLSSQTGGNGKDKRSWTRTHNAIVNTPLTLAIISRGIAEKHHIKYHRRRFIVTKLCCYEDTKDWQEVSHQKNANTIRKRSKRRRKKKKKTRTKNKNRDREEIEKLFKKLYNQVSIKQWQ